MLYFLGGIIMKNIKKLLSLVLVLVMVLSLTACHKKDEVAISLGEHKITAAVYLTALISAEQEARNIAYENASATNVTLSKDEDYYKQTIDGKDFVTYVKDTAIELCKQYLALDKLLAEGKYKLSEEVKKEADEMASYYWNSYGLSQLYGANSISYNTYKQTVLYSMMADEYFMSIYGEGGSKEVSKEDIKKSLNDNYVLAYALEGALSSEMKEDEVKKLKDEFAGYKADIESGKKTFKEIYIKYNKITDEQIKEAEKVEEGKEKPKDIFASVLGGSKTNNANGNFVAVKSMAKDEIKLLEVENQSYSLIIKLDINEDEYYLNSLTEEILHILKDTEHTETLKKYTADLECKINDFADDRFNVKKIVTNSDLQASY